MTTRAGHSKHRTTSYLAFAASASSKALASSWSTYTSQAPPSGPRPHRPHKQHLPRRCWPYQQRPQSRMTNEATSVSSLLNRGEATYTTIAQVNPNAWRCGAKNHDCCRLCQDMLVRQLLAVVTHAVCSRSCPEDTFTTESLAAVLRPTANAHLNKWCGHWLRRHRLPVSLSSLNSARRLCHLQVRARGHISPFHIMSTMLKPDEEGLAEAGRRLRAGNLVAFPTGVCFAPRVKTRVSHASNV